MNKNLAISAKDEKVPFPAAVRGSKTPVLKLSNLLSVTSVNLTGPEHTFILAQIILISSLGQEQEP